MAKVLAYKEQVRLILPDYDDLEANARQDLLWGAILGFKDFVAIENLYIDLKFIQDFVPEGITIFESYEPCQYLIGAIQLIMTKSMKGMEGD